MNKSKPRMKKNNEEKNTQNKTKINKKIQRRHYSRADHKLFFFNHAPIFFRHVFIITNFFK